MHAVPGHEKEQTMIRQMPPKMPPSHSVYLYSGYYESIVSPEAYQEIKEIILKKSICKTCRVYFTPDNENVAGNICLHCFSELHSLRFLGPLDLSLVPGPYLLSKYDPIETRRYMFQDSEGWIYTTHAGPGTKEDAGRDDEASLRYHRFIVPEESMGSDRQVSRLLHFHLSIHGDITQDTILLLSFAEGKSTPILFLVKRGGDTAIQINKKKGLHRQLFETARGIVEEERGRKEGKYESWNYAIYAVLVKIINEQHTLLISQVSLENEIKEREAGRD